MKRVLRGTSEERDSWRLKPPKGIENTSSDYVSFLALPKDKNQKTRWGYDKGDNYKEGDPWTFEDQACYAPLNQNFRTWTTTCIPRYNHKSLISFRRIKNFLDVFDSLNCFPQAYTLRRKKKAFELEIPTSEDRNELYYSLLCVYRWLDCHPPIIWLLTEYLEKQAEFRRHPFQVLHALNVQYVNNGGHSFLPVSNYGISEAMGRKNPLSPVAAYLYFRDFPKRMHETPKETGFAYVCTSIEKVAKEITPDTKQVVGSGSWASEKVGPKFTVDSPVDLLYPGFSRLFEKVPETKDEAEEILTQIYDEREKENG